MGALFRRLAPLITFYLVYCSLGTVGQGQDLDLHGDLDANDVQEQPAGAAPNARMTVAYNHKPIFDKCDTYKPTVKEGSDKGTSVITVQANDPDDATTDFGRITYSIVQGIGERFFFVINNATGEVRTQAVFDRDEPNNQKGLYLTVQATDHGSPPLADLCAFKVTVLDINDNTPTFDSLEYNSKVTVDLGVDQEVMRVFAYDFDDGENARLSYYFENVSTGNQFNDYFRISENTGVVYLKQKLDGKEGAGFSSTVIVQDNGEDHRKLGAEVHITVVGSDKKSPSIKVSNTTISLKEDMTDRNTNLIIVEAESNLPNDPKIVFDLVKGKTVQTNRDSTFRLFPFNDTCTILRLARILDYETVTEYQLTIRALNFESLASSVNIVVKVKDVNDEIPTFNELLKGSIIENDVVGAQAMTVRAIDKDGTSPNNLVNYAIVSEEHLGLFAINQQTGVITSKVQFDREEQSTYAVNVKAYDLAPSFSSHDQTPNEAFQTFIIKIEDRNDNPPTFNPKVYVVHNISENSDQSKDVVEVKAEDKDDAASTIIIYSIVDGNEGSVFTIQETTGRIKVNGTLDFEKIESYNLTVRATDGLYSDTAIVTIYIQNENDELPVFEDFNHELQIKEESISEGCVINLKAYDPDIKDRHADQKIVFEVSKEHKHFLNVTPDGCVKIITKLDRDPPNGSPQYQGFVLAYDNNRVSPSLSSHAELTIVLEDINDNAPILNITEVVWYENQMPGEIVTLTAIDYDTDINGPPFIFDKVSDGEIWDKFDISKGKLMALVEFDREEQKYYDVPIKITDNGIPHLSGVSTLRVIIGDRNDNPAEDGSSEIFVYRYQNLRQDIDIGRVFVNDPDDWDLPDKTFTMDSPDDMNFKLGDSGMIRMKYDTPAGDYKLTFAVVEEGLKIPRHTVHADVQIRVKEIPEEAVLKSGSIRLKGTTIEDLIQKDQNTKLSKKDVLQRRFAKILNTSIDNVDVFTVLTSPSNSSFVDLRFSAHGSPYYASERLNNEAIKQQDELERELGVKFVMISINECVYPNACPEKSSCSNDLVIENEPAVVFTNRTSFVGVKAITKATCDCRLRPAVECFNGGTPIENGQCQCPDGFEGPNCEILGIGFDGDGWALYPTFDSCNNTLITLNVMPQTDNGLIFYVGPMNRRAAEISRDYISLEMRDGYIVLKLDLGSGPDEIPFKFKRINDGAMHKIKISFTTEDVQIEVDECPSECLTWKSFATKGLLLNANGPLQVGGRTNSLSAEEAKLIWAIPPTYKGFTGCITNLTYNSYLYNLGAPSDNYHAHVNCHMGVAQAVTFGIDSNFLVAILVCIAILLILLLAVVVHKRKQDNLNEKDLDDTRENIINYEDEGGGECDTNFDLSVLRPPLDEKPPIRDNLYGQAADVPADIGAFLDTKKRTCDKDNHPYDDVRHYGYEGDGNTSGSLSSLASCTDEGDLKFNYLSSFGPRFRKLADMYGDDASEEGSQNGGEESWC